MRGIRHGEKKRIKIEVMKGLKLLTYGTTVLYLQRLPLH